MNLAFYWLSLEMTCISESHPFLSHFVVNHHSIPCETSGAAFSHDVGGGRPQQYPISLIHTPLLLMLSAFISETRPKGEETTIS